MLTYNILSKVHEKMLAATAAAKTEKLLEQYEDEKNCLPYHLSNILIKARQKRIKTLYKILKSVIPNYYKELPLCLAINGEYTTIEVYPNITNVNMDDIIDNDIHPTMYSCSYINADIVQKYKKEITDTNASKKWATPARTRAYMYRKDKMSIAKVLTKFTSMPKTMRDDEIANVATRIENNLRPIELLRTKSLDDWTVMYSSGPSSCMTPKGHVWEGLQAVGLHPFHLYHHVPGVVGLYIARDGAVAARVVAYENPKGRKEYGRIYSINNEMHAKFVEILHENGYRSQDSIWTLPEFRVPGVFNKERSDYVCPYPYFDNFSANGIRVAFDIEKREFVFQHKAKGGTSVTECVNGNLIWAKVIVGAGTCSVCGGICRASSVITYDKLLFCSPRCMYNMGVVMAKQGNGAMRPAKREDVIYLACDDTYYTTLKNIMDTYCPSYGIVFLPIELGKSPDEFLTMEQVKKDDSKLHGKTVRVVARCQYRYKDTYYYSDDPVDGMFKFREGTTKGTKIKEIIGLADNTSSTSKVDW